MIESTLLFFDTSTKCQADKYHWFHEVSYDKLYVVGVSKWITQEAAISKIFQIDIVLPYIIGWTESNFSMKETQK